jgi:hypothetical protein
LRVAESLPVSIALEIDDLLLPVAFAAWLNVKFMRVPSPSQGVHFVARYRS